jgi:aminoglycoside 6'-N-acetyltransferase I
VEIREVTPADAGAWASFRQRLWPEASLEELAEQVRAFFDEGTQLMETAFIAWDGDDPVGFLEVSVRAYVPGADSLPAPFVEGWFVEPARRGKGVGRSLVRAAEDWARNRGFTQLGSDTLMENAAAAEAHEALGFRTVEMLRSFIKDLDAPG